MNRKHANMGAKDMIFITITPTRGAATQVRCTRIPARGAYRRLRRWAKAHATLITAPGNSLTAVVRTRSGKFVAGAVSGTADIAGTQHAHEFDFAVRRDHTTVVAT